MQNYEFMGNYPIPPPAAQPVREPHNGFGITSLVLGLVAAAVGLGPVIGAMVSVPCGLAGITFGLVNIGRLRRGAATNKWMTISGIALSVLGIIFGIVAAVMFQHAVDKLGTTTTP